MNDLDKCVVCGQTLYLVPATETPVRYCGDKCRRIAGLEAALRGMIHPSTVLGGKFQAERDARKILST